MTDEEVSGERAMMVNSGRNRFGHCLKEFAGGMEELPAETHESDPLYLQPQWASPLAALPLFGVATKHIENSLDDSSSDIESNWIDLDDKEEHFWTSACNSQWQVRTVKSKARWNDELGMAEVIEKKGKMWVTTGIVRHGKIYCTSYETLFLVQVGALLLVDENEHSLSLVEIYDKLEKENSGYRSETFNVYRHLKFLGFVVGRHGIAWSTKGQPFTELFSKLQIVELVPTFDVYSPNNKFKKTAPGDPDFTIYVSRGPPPSIAEIRVLESQCRGSSLIICHSENGRVSFFSYGKGELPYLP